MSDTDIKERLRQYASDAGSQLAIDAANHIEQLEGQLSAPTAEPVAWGHPCLIGRTEWVCATVNKHKTVDEDVPLYAHPPVIQTEQPVTLKEIIAPMSSEAGALFDDVLSTARQEQSSLSDAWDRLRSALDDHYKASYRFGEGTNRPDYDDAKRAERVIIDLFSELLAQRQDSGKDAERYRWLRDRLSAADFYYGDPPRPVLVFDWPANVGVGGNCDRNIDAAIANGAPK